LKTILIVDDDRDVRSVLKLVLLKNGFNVLEADNGNDAFTLASTRIPDLIISDVMMHNMNGFMLREMLQKERTTSIIPIILITGAAQDAGAWESDKRVTYLRKPFGFDLLLKEVLNRLFPVDRRS
jgi:CheY-like chemotaxis protein